MASWDKIRQQDDLEPCPICLANVTNRRRQKHLFNCAKAYESKLDSMDLMRCPLYDAHIIPKKFLNHHLDGNCDAANNMLRKYFESKDGRYNLEIDSVPTDFYCHYPVEVLNYHNRKLLYLLLKEKNEVKLEPIADKPANTSQDEFRQDDNAMLTDDTNQLASDQLNPVLDTQAIARAADDLD